MTEASKAFPNERMPFLDAIRGIAAMWVALFHLIKIAPVSIPTWAIPFGFGGLGVPLFYVVSAFSLCYTAELRRDERPLLAFYTRRLFRILPLFYFMIGLHTAYILVRGGTLPSMHTYLINFFCIFNFYPGEQIGIVWASWAVGVEMLFYLAFPVIFRFTKTIPSSIGFLFLALSASALTAQLAPWSFYQFFFLRHLPIFALGILIYRLFRLLQRNPARSPLGLVLILSPIALLVATLRSVSTTEEYYFASLCLAVFVLGLSLFEFRLFVNRTTQFLGTISFSFYLFHPLVITAIKPLWPEIRSWGYSKGATFLFSSFTLLIIVIPIALLLYIYIEQPGIKAGSRFIKLLKAGRHTAIN